jgi:hypothetical protein
VTATVRGVPRGVGAAHFEADDAVEAGSHAHDVAEFLRVAPADLPTPRNRRTHGRQITCLGRSEQRGGAWNVPAAEPAAAVDPDPNLRGALRVVGQQAARRKGVAERLVAVT